MSWLSELNTRYNPFAKPPKPVILPEPEVQEDPFKALGKALADCAQARKDLEENMAVPLQDQVKAEMAAWQEEQDNSPGTLYAKEFPEEIKGASYINNWAIGGEKYCLVFVQDVWHESNQPNGFLETMLKGTNQPTNVCYDGQVQRGNVDVLADIAERMGETEVYVERLTPETEAEVNQYIEKMASMPTQPKKEWGAMGEMERTKLLFVGEDIKLKEHLGAAAYLAMQGKIKLKAAESQDVLAATTVVGNEDFANIRRANYLLETVAKSGQTSAVAYHSQRKAMGRAVKAWNADNPDEQFAVIYIDTKAVESQYKDLSKRGLM